MPTYRLTKRTEIDRVMLYVTEYLCNVDWEKPWAVEVKEYVNDRSVKQNSLLWMWITAISDYTGYRKDEVHESLKRMFLGVKRVKALDGKEYEVSNSTRKLSTKAFAQYLEQIEVWVTQEVGIQLPHPDDYRQAMGER